VVWELAHDRWSGSIIFLEYYGQALLAPVSDAKLRGTWSLGRSLDNISPVLTTSYCDVISVARDDSLRFSWRVFMITLHAVIETIAV